MRKIFAKDITSVVAALCIKSNYEMRSDLQKALKNAFNSEKNKLSKEILSKLLENEQIAYNEKIPMCQDTGMVIVFLELGQDVHICNGNLYDAINDGVRKGYKNGYLRKSVVSDPILRKNTNDNTPAVIYTEIVPGNKLKITVMPKGFGSENKSSVKMLIPSDGVEGIEKFVLETVRNAGPDSCPPYVVGVGIGGTMEKAGFLSKKALLRKLGGFNKLSHIAKLEKKLLKEINKLKIGVQGFGGKITALAVNVEVYPTHIAGLPVAVTLSCHAFRHEEIII
ncbi:MAG: fumarate hydratase [Candidatus Firestonebacteria bacterium]